MRTHLSRRSAARLPRLAAGIAALATAACTTLQPQVFSDRLQLQLDAEGRLTGAAGQGPATLQEAVADTEQARARYIAAVRDLSAVAPGVGATLIGLSAFALLKGVTGGNAHDIASAGVLGTGAYAYGQMRVSPQRQRVYLAGAEALTCALGAAAPYQSALDWLGRPTDDARVSGTLHGRQAAAVQALEDLRALQTQHAGLNQSLTETVPAVDRRCPTTPRPTCAAAPAGMAATDQARLDAACKQAQAAWDRQCTAGRPASTTQHPPDPAVKATFSAAAAEIQAAEKAVLAGRRGIGVLSTVADRLWEKSVQIQLRVSAEVLKTEPDLASVASLAAGLRERAQSLVGTDAIPPLPAPGTAQAAAGKVAPRALSNADAGALAALQTATQEARRTRIALQLMLSDLDARVAGRQRAMQRCELTVPGAALVVNPPDEELQVGRGGVINFDVFGGTGTPAGSASVGQLEGKLVNGMLRFVYTAPADAAAGSRADLLFTDGARQATHRVRVTIGDAAAPASSAAEVPFKDITPDDRIGLGLNAGASDADFKAAVERCQKQVALPVTGRFDAATRAAALAGQCPAPVNG